MPADTPPPKRWMPFVLGNVAVWTIMTIILVVVPDALEPWLGFEVARVVGWAVACSVWVVAIERYWQRRVGPLSRFGLQLILWVSSALTASYISEQFRLPPL
jgi:hypothetical protein